MRGKFQKIIAPDEWISMVMKKFHEKDIKIAVLIFLFGICIYIPMITQRLSCSDGTLCGLFYRSHSDYDWEDAMGRYLLKWFAHLKSMFIFSWGAVIVGIVCLAIGSILICKMFHVEKVLEMLLIGLFIIVSPCFIETFSYYFATDAYVMCFLLVTTAVYLLHDEKSIWRAIIAAGLLFVSMAFYQAYVFVAVVLFLFVFIRDLLDKTKEWRNIVPGLFWQMGSGITAFVGYVLCEKIFKMAGLIYYQESRFNFAEIFDFEVLPKAIGNAYRYFYQYFFTMSFLNNEWKARNVIHALMLLLIIFMLGYTVFIQRRTWTYNVAIIITVILLPIAFMGVAILNWQEGAPRIMMLPTTCLFYVGILLLWNHVKNVHNDLLINICGWGIYALSCYLILIMTVYLGIYQVCMQYYADKTDSMAQRIITRIEEEYPETVAGSPVFICGDVDEGSYPQDYWITQASYIMIGTQACEGMMINNMQGYFAGWNKYMAANFGVEYEMVWGKAQEIYDSEFYKEMTLFPAEGSVQKNEEGIVVVKLKY